MAWYTLPVLILALVGVSWLWSRLYRNQETPVVHCVGCGKCVSTGECVYVKEQRERAKKKIRRNPS
jgi:hypothetical protein